MAGVNAASGGGGTAGVTQTQLAAKGITSVKDTAYAGGARGDATTDDSAAYRAFRDQIEAGTQFLISNLGYSQYYSQEGIHIPAGRYIVTDFETFLSKQTSSNYKRKTVGYTVSGAGAGLTEIVFTPGSAATFLRNRSYLTVRFSGIRFTCTVANCDFMESREADDTAGTNGTNIQDYIFHDCHWQGWRDVFVLRGADNNSEWRFVGCGRTNCTGLFLNLDESDQFLNYWIYGHSEGTNTGGFIKAVKGGSFHVYGLDCSNWIPTSSSTPLFDLRGQTHARGVCNLSVRGMRVEMKNTNCKILYSEWPSGPMAFASVDLTSMYFTDSMGAGTGLPAYGTVWELNGGNNPGSLLTVRDSALVGRMKTTTDTAASTQQSKVVFDNCEFVDATRPSDVYTFVNNADSTSNVNLSTVYGGRPVVTFANCRGKALSTQEAAAWDWAANSDRASSVSGVRTAWFRGALGKIENTVAIKLWLPIGTTVVKLMLVIPKVSLTAFGGTSQTSSISLVVKSDEASPTTLGTLTVANPSLGAYKEVVLDPPWITWDQGGVAATSDKLARLVVTPSGLSAPLEGAAIGVAYV